MRDGIGSVFWPRSAAATNALQRVAVEETRLGIPLLVGLDVIHGQRTIAPVPLAHAASFDREMVQELAQGMRRSRTAPHASIARRSRSTSSTAEPGSA